MSSAFAHRSSLIANLAGGLVVAYALYLMVVVLILVPAVNGLAPILFHQQTGRTLQFADITFNPFTLAATIEGVRNDNPDGTPFFSADEVRVDLALKSVWRGLTLDAVAIRGLQLHIAQTDADRFNFNDILEYRRQRFGTPPAASADDRAVPPIAIDNVHVDTGVIAFDAPHQTTPLMVRLDRVAFDIDGLTTRAATTDAKSTSPALALRRARLQLARADVELPREPQAFKTHIANVQGSLELFSLRDPEVQPFALAFDDESGGSVRTTGQLSLAGAQSRGQIEIKNLSLLPAARYLADKLNADYDSGTLSLDGTFSVDWKTGAVDRNAPATTTETALNYRTELRRVEIAKVSARSRDDTDTHASLGSLLLQNTRVDSTTQNIRIERATIDALQLHGWNRATRVSLAEMFRAEFGDSETSDDSAPWSLQLDAFSADNNRIDWRTDSIDQEQLTIAPLRAQASNLHWPDAQPARLAVTATINTETTLDIRGSLIPAAQSGALEGDIRGLPLTWGNRQLARHITAQITQGTLRSHFTATLEQGRLQQITSAGAIDDFQLLRNGNNAPVAAWQQVLWQQLRVDIPQQLVHIERIDFDKPQTRFRINPNGTNNFQEMLIKQPPTRGIKSETTDGAERPWQTAIDRVHVQDGTLDFRDNSLPRPFRAVIGNFTGDISDLSSAPDQIARIDLQGNVDGYAPVALTGSAAPLREKPSLDLALDFTNLDLATLTSYSRTYAGYAINRGLLTLQLSYKLHDDRLEGQNRIVITRMELGEKVESPKAVDLPLKLAIALLTDENGVIDLGVGVEGNLDNPEFSVRGIIWKALRNVIVKAVASPFRLLGTLVGSSGAEDLGVIDFEPGTDHIDAASRERMGKLVQALAKRPSLQLRVIGHADPVADATAMKQGKLDYFLEQAGVGDDDFKTRNSTWSKAVARLYEKTFPDRDIGEQTPEQLALALRDNMTLGADAMDFIAARRSLAAKRALVVELGLPTDRVLIDAATANKGGNNRAQAELKVDG